jgi:transcriptional regulator with XRE-family HTH domain
MMCDELKRLRKERGLTQVELAEKLNLSQSTIASWENGKRRPDLDLLPIIADFFGVSVDEIYGQEPHKQTPPPDLDDALVDLLVNLPPAQVQRVKDFVQGMKAADKV